MSTSIPDFWKLVIESQLLAPEQCQTLGVEYGRVKGAAGDGNSKTLSEWLISRNVLSRYQAKILLAGHAGPFVYGDYQVYDRMETGRYAGEFRAVHTLSRHPVLLHFLTGDITKDANIWAATAQHAQAVVKFNHPQVQRYFEVVDLGTFKFLVSEDLDGQTLGELLEQGPIESNDACRITRTAALGLDSLHRAGMIHGDVRPHNIWIEPTGNVKLLVDPLRYGTAPDLSNLATDTQAALRVDYLAPEFTQPGTPPNVLSDVYALGCSLYETLSGKPPFAGGDVQQKLQRHASEPIQPLQSRGVSDSVDQLVSYLMAKNPGVRYQDVSTVVQQTAPFINPAVLTPPSPTPTATLAALEAALHTKAASVPPQPSAPAAAGPRRITPVSQATAPSTPSVRAAPAPSTPKVGVVDVSPATKPLVKSASPASAQQADKKKMIQLGVGLGIAAVIIIGGLIGLSMSMGGGDDNGTTIADGTDGTTNVTPTGNSTDNGTDAGTDNSNQGDGGTDSVDGGGTDAGTDASTVPATAAAGLPQVVIDDDGQLPWESPTNGSAIALKYVPPDAQVHMAIRPAAMLASTDGASVLQSLGPDFDTARKSWEKDAGFSLDAIDSMIIAMHDNDGKFPRPSFVVRLTEALKTDELVAKWGNPPQITADSASYYKGSSWSYYIPGTDPGVFVMGSEQDIKEVAATGGALPLLRRESERLLQVSDRDRHFTLIFSPNYLFSDGRELLSGERQRMREPISWFLGDSLKASMVSMHFDNNFFVEMRMYSELSTDPHTLASEMRDRLQQVPMKVEDYIVRINPHAYWRKVSFRFPRMIDVLHSQTRVGVEGDQAVINSMLPGSASSNLVFGTSMVMDAKPGAVVVAAAPTKPKGPQTIDELLKSPTSVAFAQQSLEFSMRDVEIAVKDDFMSLPFPFAIKIIGGDLELDGITRNQQVRDVNERNKTVAEILTAIVVTAASTGEPPTSAKQKLIWVVGPDPEDKAKQIILVTTRAAAEKNKYVVPEVFKLAE